MKPKTMILMVVAVGCGMGASYMTSRLLAERNNVQEPVVETVPVLVAKTRVPGWTEIKEPAKFFDIKPFPKELAPEKALGSLDDIKGQRLNKPVEQGKPVSMPDLLNKQEQVMADKLKAGQRAIGIKVTQESLTGWILPETYVDVLCVGRGNDSTARIILQNMLVLGIDAEDQRNPEKKHILGQTVTLAASAEEAARLALGQQVGELRLMLKGQTDTALLPPIEVKASDLSKPLRGSVPETPKDAVPEEKEVVRNTDTPLPDLKEDEKPVPPVVVPPAVVEQPKPAKKEKPHVMTIIQGGTREKHVFRKGEKTEEDEESDNVGGTDSPRPVAPKPAAPKAEPTKTVPAGSPATPGKTPSTKTRK